MIYIKDNINEIYLIDDNLTIKGTSTVGMRIINMLIDKLKPFRPENGSPTLALIELLKDKGFEVLDYEMPILEQVKGMVF